MTFFIRTFVLSVVLSMGTVFAAAPTITVPVAAAGATAGTETISVNVTANGAVTTVTFNYGLTAAYGSSVSASVPATAVGTLTTANLTGLVGGQTYHFQVTAMNTDGSAAPSADQTFAVAAYAPTLMLLPPTHAGGVETIHAKVTANGTAGNAFFQYGATTAYGTNSPPVAVAANAINQLVDFALPAPLTYHYRFVFDDGVDPLFVTADDLSNDPPKAVDDVVKLTSRKPITISVLTNDTDPNGDTLKITTVAAPKNGTVTHTMTQITYTPGAGFSVNDSFTYAIDDGFGGISSATVRVQTLVSSLVGTHGGIILNYKGKAAGYFQLTATPTGAFTGTAIIDGQRYALGGAFSASGTYVGSAVRGGKGIPFVLGTVQSSTGTVLNANFAAGGYTSQVTFDASGTTTPGAFMGRYNVEISSGGGATGGVTLATTTTTSTTNSLPGGTGWASIQVYYDGTAKIDARLSDNRAFVTSGVISVLGSAATLTFFETLDKTLLAGVLTLGDSVGGGVEVDREKSEDRRFPGGYHVIESVSGARYIQPTKGKRTLDSESIKGDELTISFSGSDLPGTLSRDLSLDQDDGVTVENSGREKLDVSIDRHSGLFTASVTVDAVGTRIKGRGVLIQGAGGTGTGRGVGVFATANQTGSIAVTVIGTTGVGSLFATPAPRPTPTPTPTPVPTP